MQNLPESGCKTKAIIRNSRIGLYGRSKRGSSVGNGSKVADVIFAQKDKGTAAMGPRTNQMKMFDKKLATPGLGLKIIPDRVHFNDSSPKSLSKGEDKGPNRPKMSKIFYRAYNNEQTSEKHGSPLICQGKNSY
jgi:hypothetical protein